MSYRPYPNAYRALRNLCRQQAVHQYGRVPQRYVLGFDVGAVPDPLSSVDGHTGAIAPPSEAFPVGEYRLSTRPGVVGGGS